MERYEYRIVKGYIHGNGCVTTDQNIKRCEAEINRLADEGFRVTCCCTYDNRETVWTLERKIPDTTPYRG